jgi:hypothetical protein
VRAVFLAFEEFTFMKTRICQSLALIVVPSILICLPLSSPAALLVYEGFDYPAGDNLTNSSANSAGNSFGWAGRWAAANTALATNTAGSLGFDDGHGHSLETDGGKVIVGVPGGTTANAQPSRTFSLGTLNGQVYTGLTNSPGTYWASFLMQWVGPQTEGSTTNLYVRKGDLQFRRGSLTNATSTGFNLFAVGSPNAANRLDTPYDTWATWVGNDSSAGVQNVGLAASTNALDTVTFVVLRIDLDGGAAPDTIYTWFNWTNLTVEPLIALASTTNNSINEDGWNNIRLDANGGNATGTNTVLAFDEFRLGTAFGDVMPVAAAPQPPNITQHPQSQTVTESNEVTLTIQATSDTPMHYQWYFNTNTPVGTDTNLFTIASASTNDSGPYFCVVNNDSGSSTSLMATLTVVVPVPPSISTQPQTFTNVVGFNARFSVAANGTAPLRYQWLSNSIPVSWGTNATLLFPITSTNAAGDYSVIITNLFGTVTSSVVTLTVVPGWPAGLPAFPGADGGGKFASGGRGGIVYHVTKLDQNFSDTAPGTLRYGLTDGNFPSGVPRTIVFDVAGTFWLGRYGAERPEYDNGWDAQSTYGIPQNVTIAGQSAPGPVIIMGGVTKSDSDNIVLRNLTFAPGYGMRGFNEPDKDPPTVPTPGTFPDSFIFGAMEIEGQNVMLDHLTLLYGTAGTIWIRDQADNLTMQYCTIGLAQNYPQAIQQNTSQYQGRGYGYTLEGGLNAKISLLNNLSAHLTLPGWIYNIAGVSNFKDFRNNLTYNWHTRSFISPAGVQSYYNFINNFYLAGPGGDAVSSSNIVYAPGSPNIFGGTGTNETHAYVAGNIKDIDNNGSPYDLLSADANHTSMDFQPTAYDVNLGATLPPEAAFSNVLHHVGARWWVRAYDFALGNTNDITTNDVAAYLDQRLIKETATGTGKITAWADDPFNNDPSEGWEWRGLLALRADSNTYSAPFSWPASWDTDGDGMPDTWESDHGLNPNVPNNNGDFDNDGYTDLEEYLDEIAAWPAPGEIHFTGNANNRYASIFNWQVNGVTVNIAGSNTVTASLWQPSRYDTAVISGSTCVVDAAGQHAGTLRITNSAELDITGGWLNVANTLKNSSNSTVCVLTSGSLRVTNNLINDGTLLLSGNASLEVGGAFTNTGTLDIMTWNGTLPPGLVNAGTILYRSLIAISSFGLEGTNFNATIQGYNKHTYRLQYCDDLGSGNWQSVGAAVAGTNAPIQFTHSGGAGAEQRFYRVAVNP